MFATADPVPLAVGGVMTLAAIVGLGIFVYPRLLRRRRGLLWIALATVGLTALFFVFDQGRGQSATLSLMLALLWAIAPLIAGAIVYRMQRGSKR